MSHRIADGDIPRRRFLELGLKGGLALATVPAWLKDLGAAQGAGSGVATAVEPALLERAIRKGLAKGGDFAEVYLEKRISRSILLEEGKFKSAVFGISQGAGVRVLSGDRTGYAYTDEPTGTRSCGRRRRPRPSPRPGARPLRSGWGRSGALPP
jgi:TldD protein